MIAEISATWAALNAVSKAVTSAFKTVEDVKAKQAIADIQDSLIDLQSKLLAIQSQYEALAEIKRQLDQKIVDYDKWNSDSARYKLEQIAPGIHVYVFQKKNAADEPTHWLCPACFQERKKSILTKTSVDYTNYKCHRCSFDVAPTSSFPPGSNDHFTY